MRNDITLIKEALCRYSCLEAEATRRALQSVESPSPEFFTELDRRVAEIKKVKGGALTFKKAITALIAATLIIAVLAVTAYAISEKINIGGFFVEWFEGYAKLNTDSETNPENKLKEVSVSYIPDGFVSTDVSGGGDWISYQWKYDESIISLTVTVASDADIFLNTENNYSVITVGEHTIYKNEYTESIYTLWTDDKNVYKLNCLNVLWDEMVKIIEGISYAAE